MRNATRMVVLRKSEIGSLLSKFLFYFDANQGVTLATGNNISEWRDIASGLVATQATSASQPLIDFRSGQAYVDFANNNTRFLTVNNPLTIANASKIYFCFSNVIIAGTINASSISSFEVGRYGNLFSAIILFNGIPSVEEDSIILEFLKGRLIYNSQTINSIFFQAGDLLTKRVTTISDVFFPSITSFQSAFQGCSSLTSFPLIDTRNVTSLQSTFFDCSSLASLPSLDTRNVTSFSFICRGCSSLTSFPLIDTSNGTVFNQGWSFTTSLTSFPLININKGTTFQFAWINSGMVNFPANFFDNWTATPIASCFEGTWQNCTALTSQSVENILVSIAASGRSAPVGATGTQPDITINYSTATGSLSAATNSAASTLKSRGWKPRVNGTYI